MFSKIKEFFFGKPTLIVKPEPLPAMIAEIKPPVVTITKSETPIKVIKPEHSPNGHELTSGLSQPLIVKDVMPTPAVVTRVKKSRPKKSK